MNPFLYLHLSEIGFLSDVDFYWDLNSRFFLY
jgi:hypothetical protein